MANLYLTIRTLHIVSATLLLGTGLGTAFFMLMAHRSRDARALATTSRHVVLADWIFTLPAVLTQLVSGLWLARFLGIPWTSTWLLTVLTMFCSVGLCWIPVVFIQIRLRDLAALRARIKATDEARACEREIDALMRIWTALGIPAFLLTLLLLGLMVFRVGMS